MTTFVSVSGKITTGEQAVVSALDHGFLYGEGVYETLRTYNRRPFCFERHMHRLRQSAQMIDLTVPLSDADLLSETEGLIAACAEAPEVYVRILLTRAPGEISYDPTGSPATTYVIVAKPLTPPSAATYADGVKVSVVSHVRSYPNGLSPLIKSNNLLGNAMAAREAYRRGAFEGLMLNHRGEITECTQSNFFVVKRGRVLTPPIECGLLAGITRWFSIEIAPDAIGTPVDEAILHISDLLDADEAFLTSTTREIVPVVAVDGHRVGSGKPGAVTLRLLDAFRRAAAASTGSLRSQPVP